MTDAAKPTRTRPPHSVEERLSAVTTSERQAAFRALLAQPMLSTRGSSADRFALVRRHSDWLRDWLADNCGWGLHLDSEFARLRKSPPDVRDATRAAREPKSRTPFSRRRYVIFCLALATLERGDRQTTLGNLAKEIIALASADAEIAANGIIFDLASRDQRSDLVQVLRYLLDLRVLDRLDGDEREFLRSEGDVLYNINRPILAMMLNVRQGPSSIDPSLSLSSRMDRLLEEQRPDTDDARKRELRFRLTRRLLDDPVLYFDDLDPEELDYLTKQRGRLLRRIEEATGLLPEVRAEGIAMLDDRGDVTDLDMPQDGTEGHFTLLTAEFLAQRIRGASHQAVGYAELSEHASRLIEEHASHWKKAVRESGAEQVLVADAIHRLEGLRLISRVGDEIIPKAAIARYGLGEPLVEGSNTGNVVQNEIQGTLWGAED